MKKPVETKRFRDLLVLLSELRKLHENLLAICQSKLGAIKKADVKAMGELSGEEQEIARRIHEREGLRRQLMDAIGDSLGLPPRTARALPVSQLAGRVPRAQAAALKEAAAKLGEAVLRVARVNRVIGAVSRGVLGHLGRVLESVGAASENSPGYSVDGKAVTVSQTQIFEAVG